jgi:hypothetical protein
MESEVDYIKVVRRTLSPRVRWGGLRVSPIGLTFMICFVILVIIFSSDSLPAQKKKKKNNPKPSYEDVITADTLRAIIARGEWQFPITKMWDDALRDARKSHRPVLAFNVDYVDPNSIYVRDKLLLDPDVMIYLTKNFELAINDFSVDPPPTVGFDSLRNLGLRLDGLEKGYNIVSRPTGIILNSDGIEIERIPDLEHYSIGQFIALLKDFLAGRNTVQVLRKKFWEDPKNLDKHKQYLDRLMVRFDYDSILYHYNLLATDPHYGQTAEVMKEAAAEYAYLRFKQEGNVIILKNWLSSLDRHSDSAVIFAGLQDLLEYYQGRKKVDSISVYYDHIMEFSGDRDPDLLNNFAWDLATYSKRYDSALVLVNEAIAKDSKNSNYYDTRALVDYYHKEYTAAVTDARLALKYGKADKEYFKERMEFYEKEKKRVETEAVYPSSSKKE